MRDSGNREIELKFKLDPARADAIVVHLCPGVALVSRKLESIYFDTPDQALRKAGCTLRVREDGGRWTQTVKTPWGGESAGRGEWESAVDGDAPDPAWVQHTPAGVALGDRVLERLFTVSVDRRSFMLESSGGAVEVSLDHGTAIRADRSVAFDELELELKSGEPAVLFDLAARLRTAFALRPGFTTKADRGFALIDAKPSGRHFEAPGLTRKMTAGEAFTAIAWSALKQIADNAEELRSCSRAEVVHQMRVGARRLQCTLVTFEPIIADRSMEGITTELKWLSSEFDAARNLDVFLAGPLGRSSRLTPCKAEMAGVRRQLLMAREGAYASARAAVESDRFSALLLNVLAWIEVGPWKAENAGGRVLRDGPIGDFAAHALEKATRRVRKRGRHFDHLSTEERHKLRIRAKTLRYAADVFDGLFAKRAGRARRFLAVTKALLDCLGELNDIATGEGLIADSALPRRLTELQAAREKRLIGEARGALEQFGQVKRFWRKRS